MEFSSSTSNEPDWAWFPENILVMILTELFLLSDVISFGSVCKHWRSLTKERLLQELNILPYMSFNKRLPMLLVPALDSSENSRNLFNVVNEGVYYDLRLLVPFNNRCIGSSHGWLIFLDSLSFVVTLFNPFFFGHRKGTIHLPVFLIARDTSLLVKGKRSFFPEYYVSKAVLSGDPLSCPDYSVMMIYGETRRLTYWSAGDTTWTKTFDTQPMFFDIIFRHGLFHAVNACGELYTWDVKEYGSRPVPASEPVVGPTGYYSRRYIVESPDGETLLQALRLVDTSMTSTGEPLFETLGFVVYRLETDEDVPEWVPVMEIGDVALFLGDNYSTYVKASECEGIMPNSIYFTDDYHDVFTMYHKPYQLIGPGDMGVYLLGDHDFLAHYVPRPEHNHLPPPIWLLPTI